MSRTLLLCFIHGFKGNDDSFGNFPEDLKKTVSSELPDHHVESVVYPQYATKGELAQASVAFLDWLKERVMDIRKARLEKPWPPSDRQVGVVLVAHSMGGFVASESLFHILDERAKSDNPDAPMFPLIQGILAFDTPYNGLARSMFVYGAFSNYQKVSSVFNVMTALSTAPASLSMALKRGATSLPGPASSSSTGIKAVSKNPAAWKTWQLVAVRTGTVGAIAAGGVAAYVHRQKILEGVQSMRGLKRQDLVEGYQQGVDRLGQGLAYINRGNVGRSFAWLSDHFTFVGVLMKQQELGKRLERLARLGGVGVHDVYASMGENGYWSGGYFVPERTFCAVPDAADQPAAHALFSRHVVAHADDEIQAHMSMFRPERNEEYPTMVMKASKLAAVWFNDDSPLVDDPKLTEPGPADSPENAIKATDEGVEVEGQTPSSAEALAAAAATGKGGGESLGGEGGGGTAAAPRKEAKEEAEEEKEKGAEEEDQDDDSLPDESPLDIAAAATLTAPLPGGDAEGEEKDTEVAVAEVQDKQGYVRYLMGIAQQAGTGLSQAGTGVKGYFPAKLPTMPKASGMMPSMPSMPSMSMPNVSIPSVGVPSVGLFSSKKSSATATEVGTSEGGTTQQQPREEEKGNAAAGDSSGGSGGGGGGVAGDVKTGGEKSVPEQPTTTGDTAAAATTTDAVSEKQDQKVEGGGAAALATEGK